MADYKKVVEMLGEHLASFLELAKKLLIDWAIEPKKLLHALHQIRKEDLVGLVAGTHEIKAKPEPEKFVLFTDLGEIVVPDDFDPSKCLKAFSEKNRKKFYSFNNAITDDNFPNPTHVLKPGDKLWVRVFKQSVSGITTSEERMAFLVKQNAIHTGAQGASLVWEQKRNLLPKGYWYCSFDEKEHLWKDAGGRHGVPGVDAGSGGGFGFNLGSFETDWTGVSCILCFCDKKEL